MNVLFLSPSRWHFSQFFTGQGRLFFFSCFLYSIFKMNCKNRNDFLQDITTQSLWKGNKILSKYAHTLAAMKMKFSSYRPPNKNYCVEKTESKDVCYLLSHFWIPLSVKTPALYSQVNIRLHCWNILKGANPHISWICRRKCPLHHSQ